MGQEPQAGQGEVPSHQRLCSGHKLNRNCCLCLLYSVLKSSALVDPTNHYYSSSLLSQLLKKGHAVNLGIREQPIIKSMIKEKHFEKLLKFREM